MRRRADSEDALGGHLWCLQPPSWAWRAAACCTPGAEWGPPSFMVGRKIGGAQGSCSAGSTLSPAVLLWGGGEHPAPRREAPRGQRHHSDSFRNSQRCTARRGAGTGALQGQVPAAASIVPGSCPKVSATLLPQSRRSHQVGSAARG